MSKEIKRHSAQSKSEQNQQVQTSIVNPKRRMLLWAGLSVPATTVLSACNGSDDSQNDNSTPEKPEENNLISSFTLAVLPDTQFYARYATSSESSQYQRRFGSEPFNAQTQWIAQNALPLNIAFTLHLGDVVDQVGKPEQWKIADIAMQQLELAKAPYSILAGNHDVLSDVDYAVDPVGGTDSTRDLTREPYLQWFSTTRSRRQATFGGRDPSGFHEYHIFTVEGQSYLVLALSWRISDTAINWARQVIAKHPTLPVILSNHQLLDISPDGLSPKETEYGKMLWERLIRDNDQIFITLNGHHHGAAHLTKINDYGNPVELMVVDYQMAYQGGNGLMRLYEFDLTNNKIKVISFSPWVKQKPSETLNSFDQAVLTGQNEAFEIEMDFKTRFARFNSNFTSGTPTIKTSLAEQAKAIILANYIEPEMMVLRPPQNSNDYPLVSSTVAHWRFNGSPAGQSIPVAQQIIDISGNGNHLTRYPLDFMGTPLGSLEDLTWSNNHHYLSANPGGAKFMNARKSPKRLSFFVTDTNAPMNAELFNNGYTVEAFIKIDPAWTAQNNAWMNIMTRSGNRGSITNYQGGDAEAPPVIFAISSLKEVQWEITPATPNSTGKISPKTNWSGEILTDKWVHIAIVNDPVSADTIMYIEGAPVLRNASAIRGLGKVSDSSPWIVGAGTWDGDFTDGFLGEIGEIRIVNEALPAAKWLTARAS